jgi:hypothetical protein
VEKIRDRFGSRTGEQVTRRFAAILTELTRRMDLSARWEGGVFISILSRCKAGGAAAFTGRVQEEVRADVFPWGKVTVSAGIAEFEPGMGSPDLLIAAADRALFAAREESTDRYVIAGTRAEAFLEREPPSHPSAQRGGLRLENQPHGGFQLVPAPRSEASTTDVTGDGSLPTANPSERVFVVHGDGGQRAHITGIMKKLRYSVESAASGETALMAIEKVGPPHLLITDLVLPGMGGFTLVENLERERTPTRDLPGGIHPGRGHVAGRSRVSRRIRRETCDGGRVGSHRTRGAGSPLRSGGIRCGRTFGYGVTQLTRNPRLTACPSAPVAVIIF